MNVGDRRGEKVRETPSGTGYGGRGRRGKDVGKRILFPDALAPSSRFWFSRLVSVVVPLAVNLSVFMLNRRV